MWAHYKSSVNIFVWAHCKFYMLYSYGPSRFWVGTPDALVLCKCMGPAHLQLFPPMPLAGPRMFLVGAPNASVWAQQTWNNLYRCHQLGPEFFRWVPPILLYGPSRHGIMSTDGIGWAQMFFGGCPRCPCVGPADLN
jgi:hypothetical protein